MIERIKCNEDKLDKIEMVINNLEKAINDFETIQPLINDVNNYYGSREWFSDKENLEKGKIQNIKAGILSEDAVWNLLEKISELNNKINEIKKEIWEK